MSFLPRRPWEALSHPRLTVALGVLCALVALPLALRMVAYEPFVCSGSSMFPAIQDGDRFVGERLDAAQVHRGDVVLVRSPRDTEGVVVKRVAALGGDEVWVHDGRVELNGQAIPRCELGPLDLLPGISGDAFMEDLDGRRYLTLVFDGAARGDRCVDAPCRVPEGELFVVGDNRDDSEDSRTWGSVPMHALIGRARWVGGRAELTGAPTVPEPLRDDYQRCLGALRLTGLE